MSLETYHTDRPIASVRCLLQFMLNLFIFNYRTICNSTQIKGEVVQKRVLGKTGLEVSALGFGGAPIGFNPQQDDSAFVHLLQVANEQGVNFFDTAPDYRRSEILMGQAFHGRRQEVILASKCGRIQTFGPNNVWESAEDWSSSGILKMIEGSLKRLQTDYLDLVQLHSPPGQVLEDGGALAGALKAKEEGKVRWIGLSADGPEAIRAVEMGVFDTLQTSYSLLQQEAEEVLIPAAAAQGMGVIIKQPLANNIPNLKERPAHPDWKRKWDVAQQLDWELLSGPDDRLAIALRWVLSNPQVSTAIAGTSLLNHFKYNLAAANSGQLDESVITYCRAAYRQARLKEQI